MRIIGGKFAGRLFESKGFKGRPTTDLAKQALFNILANRYNFEGLNVLDLYAGTGAIAFEFLSRGSAVTLVEANRKAALELIKNAKAFNFDRVKIHCMKVEQLIDQTTERFDIIFADPPYDSPTLPNIPQRIATANLLNEDGLLIVEHRQRTAMAITPDDERRYGDSVFSFYHAPLDCSASTESAL